MTKYQIPDSEFRERLSRTEKMVGEAGLDCLLVHSNEADFANVRYLSDYWPLFESAGVLVMPGGPSVLLIGPESETFARKPEQNCGYPKNVRPRTMARPGSGSRAPRVRNLGSVKKS